jgi:hypothetical protein
MTKIRPVWSPWLTRNKIYLCMMKWRLLRTISVRTKRHSNKSCLNKKGVRTKFPAPSRRTRQSTKGGTGYHPLRSTSIRSEVFFAFDNCQGDQVGRIFSLSSFFGHGKSNQICIYATFGHGKSLCISFDKEWSWALAQWTSHPPQEQEGPGSNPARV